MDDLVDSISADTSGLRCGHVQLRIVFITPSTPEPTPAHQSAQVCGSSLALEPAPARESAPEPTPARESAPEAAPVRESTPESTPACESAPVPTEEVGTEPPPHPRKRRKKASSIPQGPEAFPEPAVGPEATPEVLEPNAPPVSPDVAKRAVFVFYILTVLRAWRTHVRSWDQGPEQPEPAAVPGQPEPATGPRAVPESPPPSALPPPPRLSAPPPPPPRPSARLKPTWLVPPAPPWHSAGDSDLAGAPMVCSSSSPLAFS
ncbi:hypothetical protein DPX16_15530 [Anabarilius grahami]|uniref:Uncharacterized protein n=1 Tax=Anabarilius grahami TaxID=495550 RepID=A0A3N0XFC4_ANAGA|nr:hypothetical protein DPX16_15530 [Anabarilius grahami]